MFLELFTYTALIQFMGAFNFAYVFDKFREQLIKHVFNIDKVFADEFMEINSKVATLDVTISSLKSTSTRIGFTNFDSIEDLKAKFYELKKSIKESESKLKEEYLYQDIPAFIEEIFLTCGLYCIADLFFIALITNTYANFHVCFWFGLFTSLTLVQLTYYSLCNFSYKVKDVMPYKWFSKGLEKASILSISLFFISGIFCFLNAHVFPHFFQFEIPRFIIFSIPIVALILPFAGFIICYAFIKRSDCQSRGKIKAIANSRKKELDKLNIEAEAIDRAYRTFASPTFGGNQSITTPKFNGGNQGTKQAVGFNKTPKQQNTGGTQQPNKPHNHNNSNNNNNPPKQSQNKGNQPKQGRNNANQPVQKRHKDRNNNKPKRSKDNNQNPPPRFSKSA